MVGKVFSDHRFRASDFGSGVANKGAYKSDLVGKTGKEEGVRIEALYA